jgi:hypothetical protein
MYLLIVRAYSRLGSNGAIRAQQARLLSCVSIASLLACVLGGAPVVSLAAPLVVVNPGFEYISGESPFNEFAFGPLNG